MGQSGTKAQFTGWLSGKHLTYTRYTGLAIEEKAALYKEYQKSRRKGGSTDGCKEEQKEG